MDKYVHISDKLGKIAGIIIIYSADGDITQKGCISTGAYQSKRLISF
jgi:hypothetical protein